MGLIRTRHESDTTENASNSEELKDTFSKKITAEGAATHFDGNDIQSVSESYARKALISSLEGGAI